MIGVKSIALRKKAGAQSEYDRELGWFRTDNQRKGCQLAGKLQKGGTESRMFLAKLVEQYSC